MLARQDLNQNEKPLPPKKSPPWYFRTGSISFVYGICVFFLLIISGETGEFSFIEWTEWFNPFILLPAFIGNHISGTTYIGREIDLCSQKCQRSYERAGTLVGIIFGLTVGIGLTVIRGAGDFLTGGALNGLIEIAHIGLTILTAIANFAGFGNRLGGAIQDAEGEGFFERLSSVIVNEKKPILVGAAVGFTFSLTLWLLGAVALTSFGALSFFTGGLPLWIMGGLFVLSYTSACASGSDYITRAYKYVRAVYYNDAEAKKTIEGRYYQHKGATIGIVIGAIIATAIIITRKISI